MEGVLWKWTNYWNGWQTRWFILENGVLSYYKSQDEVNQGCKGSMKVSSCQINVNALDATRLDVVIPGDQRIYLRAATQQDRQKWLVALGSAKACVDSNQLTDVLSQESNPSTVKSKKSELRLYCDIMMQQVHAIKSAVNNETGPELQKLDDASSLLSATCDTFIQTLEDCMKLTNSNHETYSPASESTVPPSVPATLVNGFPKTHVHGQTKNPLSRSLPDNR